MDRRTLMAERILVITYTHSCSRQSKRQTPPPLPNQSRYIYLVKSIARLACHRVPRLCEARVAVDLDLSITWSILNSLNSKRTLKKPTMPNDYRFVTMPNDYRFVTIANDFRFVTITNDYRFVTMPNANDLSRCLMTTDLSRCLMLTICQDA